jgi:trans-aconitate methyltransferase
VKNPNPIDLLFADMDKLSPGDDSLTLYVLRSLPQHRFEIVVDAGCGAGRQTMVLASELGTPIQAVDSYQPFLSRLKRRAKEKRVAHLVRTHCMDMKNIPSVFPTIDLLWAEGAAYNIGFANALTTWAKAIQPNGFAVVSELCWLHEQIPGAVTEFFRCGYPEMQSVPQNIAIAEEAGYKIFNMYTLPQEAWVKDYYDVLEPRAKSLVTHPDVAVRNFAVETLKEIETFGISENSYGYVFFVLQRSRLRPNEPSIDPPNFPGLHNTISATISTDR